MTKQVTFRSISIEGFKSYSQPTKFQFANTGLHLIKGLNGAGKTTLFSALVWCLYKVNLNDTVNTKLPTLKHYRTKEFKGTRVQVVFGIGKYKYLVARHIAYKGTTKGLNGEDGLMIFRKEKMDKTHITAADIVNDELYINDQQKYLNMLLGIDAKTFLNSVIFGQRMGRLMESKDADKRSLFERLFDTSFIDDLKTKATERITEANTTLVQAEADLKSLLYNQQTLQQQLEEANTILANFKKNKALALSIIRKDHGVVKSDIELLEKQIELSEKMNAKSGKVDSPAVLAEASNQASEMYYGRKTELANTQRDIDENNRLNKKASDTYQTLLQQLKNIKTTCPTCGGKLASGTVAQAREALQVELDEALADINRCKDRERDLGIHEHRLLEEVKKWLGKYEKALDEHNKAKQNNNNAATSAVELATLVERRANKVALLQQMVKAFNAEKAKQPPAIDTEKITKKLAALEETIPATEKKVRGAHNLIKRLNWWLKAFGANGIKTHIFSAMLNRLNECVAVYTAYLGLNVTFGIDLSKASKPFYCTVSLDGVNEIDYDMLSGGEKQRVDLAISFGLQDASETVSSFNISIVDEPEGNLDAEMLEVLDTLLRIRAERKAVYVISHNSRMDLSGASVYEISGGKNQPSTIE